ncbi:Gfo/Idh/MocA family protein [Tepidanaerobacter syntrophicus]|uniref:Gfo/Idh/MocA family protein n=1 Tax=Tepidanaerobacter syntrophicus TaxID=224999 RepID=UPI001BD42339|nr:Gfo/Idh/MocA family oxidoreductase [Tepidanaerobacter syntrophicus]
MVKIGMVGFGGIGNVHYDNYKNIDGCKVVAVVCNTAQDKEKAAKFNLAVYDDIASMTANEQIDVIDVCTPTYLHKEHVVESLNCGKHVIVEKPMALCAKDAKEMFDLAAEKNLLLFVGQVVRFTRESEILYEAVKSEKYGKPLDGYFIRLSACPTWSKGGWLFDRKKSGLVPFDLHVHDLDLIISIFGKPKNFTYTSCGRPDAGYKEHYRFNYTLDNLNITAEAAWFNANYPFKAAWRVYFENAVLENDGKKVTVYEHDKEPFTYNFQEDKAVATEINLPASDMFYRELSHFIECIERGVPSERIHPDEIIEGIKILEKITEEEKPAV